MALKGDAAFEWDSLQLALEAPLRDISAVENIRRFVHTSADRTTRNVVTIGSGVDEIEATIRFELDVTLLKAMLEAGLNDTTLTYWPSLGGSSDTYPCKLVSVNGSEEHAQLLPDRDMWWDRRFECRVRLRRTDGGTFDALLEGN